MGPVAQKNVAKMQRILMAGQSPARRRVAGGAGAEDRRIAGALGGVRISPLRVEPEGSTLWSGDVKGFWNYPPLAGK